MSDLSWAEGIKSRFAGSLLGARESAPGELEFTVAPSAVRSFVEALKNLEGGGFDHLADLTAYDRHPQTPRFHVVYELISMLRKKRCSVISPLGDDAPAVESVTSLWPGANWLEREVYDMYGIRFDGHPDMRRILLPEAFRGYPLRKDFTVDYRQKFPESRAGQGGFDPFGSTIVKTEKA